MTVSFAAPATQLPAGDTTRSRHVAVQDDRVLVRRDDRYDVNSLLRQMATVGKVDGITLVIWPFDHLPAHVHAFEGTPNTPSARMSRFVITTGKLMDEPPPKALPTAKVKMAQQWIVQHQKELQIRWQQLQP